mgnify:CR=1 FL=1
MSIRYTVAGAAVMPPAARGLFADRHQQWREAQALELHTGFVGFGAAFKGAEVNTGFGMGFYTGFFELGDQLFTNDLAEKFVGALVNETMKDWRCISLAYRRARLGCFSLQSISGKRKAR